MDPDPTSSHAGLIRLHEAPPFSVVNPSGSSPVLLICDHASAAVPESLNGLGLSRDVLETHIGWDIGAAGVARQLAERLNAVLVLQSYSRLVIDCNRPLDSPASIPERSDNIAIPGNAALAPKSARLRAEAVFRPYHSRISEELDRRAAGLRPTVLLSIHSFTPVMQAFVRPWHAGTLYNRDARLASLVMKALRQDPSLTIGDNQPYAVSDTTDFAIPRHGERRGILHLGIELRQDLVATPQGQQSWANRLFTAIELALQGLAPTAPRMIPSTIDRMP